eukprot:UN25216
MERFYPTHTFEIYTAIIVKRSQFMNCLDSIESKVHWNNFSFLRYYFDMHGFNNVGMPFLSCKLRNL